MATTEDEWLEAGLNAVCDTSAGEVYIPTSPGRVEGIDICKGTCKDNPKCKSITYYSTGWYYKSGWCSLFSTSCSNTKNKNGALSLKFVIGDLTSTTTQTVTTG